MSRPYNNQWVLGRTRWRRRRRKHTAGSRALAQAPTPLQQEPHGLRKHPRWIDRDT